MSKFQNENKKVDFGPFLAQNVQIWSFAQKSSSVTFLHFWNPNFFSLSIYFNKTCQNYKTNIYNTYTTLTTTISPGAIQEEPVAQRTISPGPTPTQGREKLKEKIKLAKKEEKKEGHIPA